MVSARGGAIHHQRTFKGIYPSDPEQVSLRAHDRRVGGGQRRWRWTTMKDIGGVVAGKIGGHCADVQAPDSGKQRDESEENRCNSDERLKSRHHRERTVRYVKLWCSCASPTG